MSSPTGSNGTTRNLSSAGVLGDNTGASIGDGLAPILQPSLECSIPETPQRKGKKKRALPPKKTSAVLAWTDAMVLDLMTLRYETHADRFSYAKNNAALKAAWLLLATELSDNQEMPISSEQCKNKLKWLRRKWAEYNADVRATGNAETEIVDPPGLVLMQKFWSGSADMNGQTLADSEADSVAIVRSSSGRFKIRNLSFSSPNAPSITILVEDA